MDKVKWNQLDFYVPDGETESATLNWRLSTENSKMPTPPGSVHFPRLVELGGATLIYISKENDPTNLKMLNVLTARSKKQIEMSFYLITECHHNSIYDAYLKI